MNKDLLKIINYYGVNNQQKKLNEEVFELQEAIYQYKAQKEACEFAGCKKLHVDSCKEHITEEIADVFVILSQFIIYYDLNEIEIDKIADYKIKRQLERIENEMNER